MLKQGIVNAKLSGDTTTAVSLLQWSQSLNMANKNKQRRWTDTLRETLHDGQIVFQDRGSSGSYLCSKAST